MAYDAGLDGGDSNCWLGSSMLDRYIVWEPRFNDLMLYKQVQQKSPANEKESC